MILNLPVGGKELIKALARDRSLTKAFFCEYENIISGCV